MTMRQNNTAKKKAVNLSVNSDLLKEAKDMNINLSNMLEKTLEQKIREEKIKNWQEENKDFIEAYNKDVEENGLFAEEHRCF